jgi:hypothetical protein
MLIEYKLKFLRRYSDVMKIQNNFSGVYRGGYDILVRAKLALAEGVTMQLTVRSTNADVAELVTSAVG